MKKKLMLLVMLVSFLASSLTFLSCKQDQDVDHELKLEGTSWVHASSMKLEFTTDKDFTLYQNSDSSTWQVVYTGTYTIDGNDVTWGLGTATVKGKTLTMTNHDGSTMKFQKQ